MNSEELKRVLVADGEKVSNVKVLTEKEFNGAVFVYASLQYEDCEMYVSFIIYDDGTWFSPYDWHGYMPESPEDIEEIEWMIGATGRKAIMLNGLPRMLA